MLVAPRAEKHTLLCAIAVPSMSMLCAVQMYDMRSAPDAPFGAHVTSLR